jgi:hypothetical protein
MAAVGVGAGFVLAGRKAAMMAEARLTAALMTKTYSTYRQPS